MRAKIIYNNNIVLALKENGDEIILVGKGIGFGLKKGQKILAKKIEKKFELKEEVSYKFKELIQDIPLDCIYISEEIIMYIKENSHEDIDDLIYVTLTDHKISMVERIRMGIEFDPFIVLNVKRLYKAEYNLALDCVKMLRSKLDLHIADEEANFIALHIVNAQINSSMIETHKILSLIEEITNIIKQKFYIKIDSMEYDRFMIHCRFFAQRIVKQEYLKNDFQSRINFLIDTQKYDKEYRCINEISEFIEKKYKYQVSMNEKEYLFIHLVKLVS